MKHLFSSLIEAVVLTVVETGFLYPILKGALTS